MRLIFARISWMTFYKGDASDQPISHMAYVRQAEGPVGERFNFAPIQGRLFGYVAPSGEAPYQLGRIDPSAQGADRLDGVLLVFMAARPPEFGGGKVVVGWYRNATLYPDWRKPRRSDRYLHNRKNWEYCCECKAKDAVLLPSRLRNWQVPRGRGGMRQAKVRYLDARQGWMRRLVSQIAQYRGPSLTQDPAAEAEDVAALRAEVVHAGSQGFALDSRMRGLIEERAIAVAKAAFGRQRFPIRD